MLPCCGLTTRLQGVFQGPAAGFRPVETNLHPAAEQERRNAARVLPQRLGDRDIAVGSILIGGEVVAVDDQPGMAYRQRVNEWSGCLTVRAGTGPEEVEMNPAGTGSVVVDPDRRLGGGCHGGNGSESERAQQAEQPAQRQAAEGHGDFR
jgi:hypothetical protein